MSNYIKYGTDDSVEIMLIKYGFGFDDIEWIKNYVISVDENEIAFNSKINQLEPSKYEIIKRFIY